MTSSDWEDIRKAVREKVVKQRGFGQKGNE
jgi:hypothetical protein